MNRINILLVEDDAVNQFVVVTSLRKRGMGVTVAQNGKEAVALIRSKGFSLVLMDINMPVMDGLQATRCIREIGHPYFMEIPILAFSASSMIATKEDAARHGMTDYLPKPFHPEELQNKINEYIMRTSNVINENYALRIDFDQYTDGDPEFCSELAAGLIDNIREIRQSLRDALPARPQLFFETLHKVTTTIFMLNDDEFSRSLELVRDHLKNRIRLPEEIMVQHVAFAEQRAEEIIHALASRVAQ